VPHPTHLPCPTLCPSLNLGEEFATWSSLRGNNERCSEFGCVIRVTVELCVIKTLNLRVGFAQSDRAITLPGSRVDVFDEQWHHHNRYLHSAKVRERGGGFDKCEVRLVVQGQHTKWQNADGVGDDDDVFSLVAAARGFPGRTILSLNTQLDIFTDHVEAMRKILATCFDFWSHSMLNGMPSAARAWQTTMSVFLQCEGSEAVGFQESRRKVTIDGHRILLRAHIEDFVIACARRPVLDAFCKRLLEAFEGTYEGPLEHYLGCEIACDLVASTAQLSPTHDAQEVFRIFGFWDNLPRIKPTVQRWLWPVPRLQNPDFHKRYGGIVGSLDYLVTTRPAWSYSELSKYVQFPGQSHMEAAEHGTRRGYRWATWNETITYTRGSRLVNESWGWVDVDWAGNIDNRRSHTGYILMMNGGSISWKSHRQDNVSLSTSEAEFVAASQAAKEVVHLRETLHDFGYQQSAATDILEDNLVCIAMSENPVCRKFSRNIDIRRYFIRELAKARIVKLIPIRTHKRVADPLTKTWSLPSRAFIAHRCIAKSC